MHEIKPRYQFHFGLDLKSSDLNRDMRFASGMKNAQYRKSGAVEKRRGWQKHSASAGGYGDFVYKYIDSNDTEQQQVLAVGRSLYKLNFSTLTVTYGGAELSASITVYFDPDADEYKCILMAGQNEVLNFSLGQGFDEASPVTLADLDTAISAIPDFTATVSGDNTVPAAFLRIVRDHDLKTMAWPGKAGYWTAVNCPLANPFDGSYTRRNNIDFENVSGVNSSNVFYLSNGFDNLYKYDGQNLYRAGLPAPATLTSVLGAAGTPTGSNYVHKAQYMQIDNAGNVVQANAATSATPLNPASERMTVTVANILAGTGFNTNAAIVNGAGQINVTTITVDNGSGGAHTMKAGDTAYFHDQVTGGYIERVVTAVAATTITVTGPAVTVSDNAVISNNLRILILRNKTSATTPSVFYELIQLPNNPFTATQVYSDNLADSQVGALWEPPFGDRSLPPRGKYITSFQNLLFVTGIPGDDDRVQWSDLDGNEYFPADTNQDQVRSSIGDFTTGIAPNGPVLAVGKQNSVVVGSGTFGDNNYRFEVKAENIGVASHASMTQVEGRLAWFSSRGPYQMEGGQIPVAIGMNSDGESRISPVLDQYGFENNPVFAELFYRQKRITGFNFLSENKLLFFLPTESTQSGDRYVNSNSRVFAYDYSRDAWLEWSNLDMVSGAVIYNDEVYFKGRRYSNFSSTVVSELHRWHNLNDAYDYEDNTDPIDWDYAPQWEALGRPSVLKKFLEILIFSLEEVQNNSFNLTVRQEINYERDASIAEFTMALTGSGYGQSPYGTERYGDPSNPQVKHKLANARTRSIRTRFLNSEHQTNCVISAWELLCAAPFRAEFKK